MRSSKEASVAWVERHFVFCDPEFFYESSTFKKWQIYYNMLQIWYGFFARDLEFER